MRVNTEQFRWVHGSRPRGQGLWTFFPDRGCDDFAHSFSFSGTFSEASRAAVAHAKAEGWTSVNLGS